MRTSVASLLVYCCLIMEVYSLLQNFMLNYVDINFMIERMGFSTVTLYIKYDSEIYVYLIFPGQFD